VSQLKPKSQRNEKIEIFMFSEGKRSGKMMINKNGFSFSAGDICYILFFLLVTSSLFYGRVHKQCLSFFTPLRWHTHFSHRIKLFSAAKWPENRSIITGSRYFQWFFPFRVFSARHNAKLKFLTKSE
jgi:hypothetical protein